MSADFPFEIWQSISANLSQEYLWELRHVNSSLFQLHLDRQYHSVFIGLSSLEEDPDYASMLCHLAEPYIGHRVRELIFSPFVPHVWQNEDVPWSVPSKKGTLKKSWREDSLQERRHVVQEIVMSFSSLSSILIGGFDQPTMETFERSHSLIQTALIASTDGLLSLSIQDVPIDTLALSLLQSTPVFPALQDLTITYPDNPPETDLPLIEESLATFVNKHHATLLSFTFTACSTAHSYIMSSIFQSICTIPNLHTFRFSDDKFSESANAHRLIKAHSKTLTTVEVDATIDWGLQEPTPSLPRLKSLCLNLKDPFLQETVPIEMIVRYIQGYTASSPLFSSLEIRNRPIQIEEWTTFIIPDWTKITDLQLNLTSLTVSIMDTLVDRFPRLIYVRLTAFSIHSRDRPMGRDSVMFVRLMLQRNYTSSLREIVIEREPQIYYQPFQDCLVAIAKAFPQVTMFNHQKRAEFIAEYDKEETPEEENVYLLETSRALGIWGDLSNDSEDEYEF